MKRQHFIILLFAVVSLLYFRGAVFRGEAEIPCNPNRWLPWRAYATQEEIAPPAVNTDCALAYYPRRVFATAAMRSGDLPLWDPHTFTGQPFLANFQSALLYPVNLVLYAVEPMRAMGWFLIIHLVMGGYFCWLCARAAGLSRAPAVAAALVFELNPFFLTRLGHPTFVAAASWLPLVVYAGFRLTAGATLRNAVLLAVPLAFAALAGFPQTLMHIHYALAWVLFVSIVTKENRSPLRLAACGLLGILLSFGLAAFQYLPTLEFLRASTRHAMDLPTFLSGTHHPAMILKSVIPDFFGNPIDENLWSTIFSRGNGLFRQNYVSTLNYFGVLPLVIGVYGILTGRKRLFLAGLFLFPLLVIWGTPLANAAFHLPGFRLSRPDRLILLPIFAVSIGFGFGLERLTKRLAGSPRGVVAGFVVMLLLAASGFFFAEDLLRIVSGGRVPFSSVSATMKASAFTTVVFTALALLLLFFRGKLRVSVFITIAALLACADLFLFGSRFHLTLPPESTFRSVPEIEQIREEIGTHGRMIRFGTGGLDLLPPATASLYGIHDAAGINALNIERYRRLIEKMEPDLYMHRRYLPMRRAESLESPILRMLGARPFTVDRFGAVRAITVPDPLPRASLHREWVTLPAEEILERIVDPAFDPAGVVFLEEKCDRFPLDSKEGSADIQIESYKPDRVMVRVVTDEGGMLLLTDAWFPGWVARLDGEPVPLYRANYTFRAVYAPRGEHVIDFLYEPASFRHGLAVSGVSLVLLLVLIPRRRREVDR